MLAITLPLFGCIHLIACWTTTFPTTGEQLIWIITSSATLMHPLVIIVTKQLLKWMMSLTVRMNVRQLGSWLSTICSNNSTTSISLLQDQGFFVHIKATEPRRINIFLRSIEGFDNAFANDWSEGYMQSSINHHWQELKGVHQRLNADAYFVTHTVM